MNIRRWLALLLVVGLIAVLAVWIEESPVHDLDMAVTVRSKVGEFYQQSPISGQSELERARYRLLEAVRELETYEGEGLKVQAYPSGGSGLEDLNGKELEDFVLRGGNLAVALRCDECTPSRQAIFSGDAFEAFKQVNDVRDEVRRLAAVEAQEAWEAEQRAAQLAREALAETEKRAAEARAQAEKRARKDKHRVLALKEKGGTFSLLWTDSNHDATQWEIIEAADWVEWDTCRFVDDFIFLGEVILMSRVLVRLPDDAVKDIYVHGYDVC